MTARCLTSADIKASYERLIASAAGRGRRRAGSITRAIASIDTPDALTVVFHLHWPDAAMLANFASPWNCIYSAAKLAEDPQFPNTHILGTGAFVFVEHVKGQYWRGRRFDSYFQPGKPYLDGFQADFMTGAAVMAAYKSGKIAAEFRGVTPAAARRAGGGARRQRHRQREPVAVQSCRSSSIPSGRRSTTRGCAARCRWRSTAGAQPQQLQKTTFLKYVGGLMRPGSSMATPEAELVTLPGFGHDIAASRAEARQLLAAAGVHDLKLTLLVRDIPMPHYAGADLLVDSWRQIGVTATEKRLGIFDWQKQVEAGNFDVALDFSGDFYDDPTIQLTKYVSHDLSPVNYSGSTDRFLDAPLYRPGGDQRPAAARPDRPRVRAPCAERGLYRAALVVEPHRRDLVEAARAGTSRPATSSART